MNILRKNTDYALRMMGNLAGSYGQGTIPVRRLAQEEDVSYQFACKILQKLQGAGLLESAMGPSGGYQLARPPKEITMLDVTVAMQGGLAVNRCTGGDEGCPRQAECPVSDKLCQLQQFVEKFLADVSLQDLP